MGGTAGPGSGGVEWLRLPGDLIFIIGGILPIVYLALRMFANRNRRRDRDVPPEGQRI